MIENRDYFILTFTAVPNLFYIIPKRGFGSTGDINLFRDLLADHEIKPPGWFKRPRFALLLGLILVFIIIMVVWNFQQQ